MTLDLGGLPPRLFACTPTRLDGWLGCRRRYRYTYVERPALPRGGPWAHLSMGASVHLALRGWWDLPTAERTPRAAAGLLRRVWLSDGFRDEAQSRAWLGAACGWVGRYLTAVDARAEPIGLERTVALRTRRLAFSGRVDRLDLTGAGGESRVVVVDYKTGRSPSTDLDARSSLALALYAAAAQATLRRPSGRVELHHIPSGTVAAWDHDDRSLSRHLERAEAIGTEAQTAELRAAAGDPLDELFPPDPGPGCGWCDFRGRCAEGRRAAPDQPSWALLDGDPSSFGGSTGLTVGVSPETPGSA